MMNRHVSRRVIAITIENQAIRMVCKPGFIGHVVIDKYFYAWRWGDSLQPLGGEGIGNKRDSISLTVTTFDGLYPYCFCTRGALFISLSVPYPPCFMLGHGIRRRQQCHGKREGAEEKPEKQPTDPASSFVPTIAAATMPQKTQITMNSMEGPL
jgi:hypothetical protein